MSAVIKKGEGERSVSPGPAPGQHSPSHENPAAQTHTYANQRARKPREGYRTHTVGNQTFTVRNRYVDLKLTGKGSYGFVALAHDLYRDEIVAIKKVKNMFADEINAKRTLRELKILKHLGKHENIVQLLDIMTGPPESDNFEDLYLVVQYFESDLEPIIASDQPITERHCQRFIYQVLKALKYMHSAKVLHRDLKPGNILVNGNCQLALCDFGLSRGIRSELEDLTEEVITLWYRPPELLCGMTAYDEAVDMWSLGCTLGELVFRKPLFPGKTRVHQLQLILSSLGMPDEETVLRVCGPDGARVLHNMELFHAPEWFKFIDNSCSMELADFLKRLLRFDPQERMTVEEALGHSFMQTEASASTRSSEPSCSDLFNFDFEEGYPNELPREVIQNHVLMEIQDMINKS